MECLKPTSTRLDIICDGKLSSVVLPLDGTWDFEACCGVDGDGGFEEPICDLPALPTSVDYCDDTVIHCDPDDPDCLPSAALPDSVTFEES